MLNGVVQGPGATPITNAAILVWGTDLATRTDSAGHWQLRQLPMGTHTVEARAVGFRPTRFVVDIDGPSAAPLVATLDRMTTLDTVRTRALREQLFAPEMRAFEKRRQMGLGHFRGPAELDQILPFQAADVFRAMPSIRVVTSRLGDRIMMRGKEGSPCMPDLVLDGMRFAAERNDGLIDHLLYAGDMRAVEVYPGSLGTPAEFMRVGNECGTIVIWTGRR